MSESRIRQWLQSRYDSLDADPSEIEDWILKNNESPEFDSIMLELLETTEYFDPVNSSQGYSLFKSRVAEYEKECRRERFRKVFKGVEHMAAVLLLPLSVIMFYAGGKVSDVEWLEADTSAGETMEVVLPDGSGITLGPSSKLIYPSAFVGSERKVFMMGSAYADIEKDERKPFVISSGCLDVRVLGTEFQLNSYEEDSEVEVALVDGSVQLCNKSDKREVMMRPGDIVSYDKSTGNFIRKNFAAGYYRDILENGGFQFVNQRLGDIALCLERHFGVKILIDDAGIADERYFASFINNETVDEILDVLNAQNYMKITRNGKIINISHNNQ